MSESTPTQIDYRWFQPTEGDGIHEARANIKDAESMLQRARALQDKRREVDAAHGAPLDSLDALSTTLLARHGATESLIATAQAQLESGNHDQSAYTASLFLMTLARSDLSEAAGMALRSGVDRSVVMRLFNGD